MQQPITDYINKNFDLLVEITNNITRNHDLSGDLLNEVVLQLYERGDVTLHNYNDDTIKYYLIKVIRINWFSKTSPFHYRVRKESSNYSELKPEYINYASSDVDEYKSYEELLTNVEIEFSELQWFSKRLFELYLTLGSLKKVSAKTQIPVASVGRYIREIKQEIRDNVNKKMK